MSCTDPLRGQAANETWQADPTPWQLADGSPVELLNFEGAPGCSGLHRPSHRQSVDVVRAFYSASNYFGLPASLLTDNGRIFTARSIGAKILVESGL